MMNQHERALAQVETEGLQPAASASPLVQPEVRAEIPDVEAVNPTEKNGETPPAAALEANEAAVLSRWHVEAGRKGAQRIHQLIRAGRLYEQEHGLKPGRQRLRQLIQEGKLYEGEHGLSRREARSERGPKLNQEQSLKLFFQLLTRLVKPAYRDRLLEVLRGLENDPPKKAG